MRVTRPADILCARTVLQRKCTLRNHLSRIRSHNVNTQNAVRLRISQEFHQTVGIQIRLCSAVCAEGECSDLVLHAGFFQFCLVLADPGDFGVGVHDRGDGVVVNVAVVLCDEFNGCDGFFFSLVCEHRSECAIANHANVWDLGAVFGVDDKTAAVVGFDANVLEAEALCVRAAADGDEDDVCFELEVC